MPAVSAIRTLRPSTTSARATGYCTWPWSWFRVSRYLPCSHAGRHSASREPLTSLSRWWMHWVPRTNWYRAPGPQARQHMVSQSRDGRDVVKVVDFGIAKATKRGQQTVTRTGFIVGTPAYMSPEQILGDPVDGRSDLYSLGCILYEMLTGERAFLDADGEVSLRQRLTQPPPQPSRVKHGLSGHLNSLVTTAMARDPEQRFQSAAEVRDALIGARNAPPQCPGEIDCPGGDLLSQR